MRIFSILISLIFSASAFGQIPSFEIWSTGEIELKDASFYDGELKFDFRDNIVYYKGDEKNLIFHASFIENFKILRQRGYEKFVTLPYAPRKNRKMFMIFQELYSGKESKLLGRESFAVGLPAAVSNIGYGTSNSPAQTIEEKEYFRDRMYTVPLYHFYFLLEDNSIHEVKLTKKSVLKAIQRNKYEVKRFINENKIYFRSYEDLFKVLNYYDAIKGL